MARVRGNAHRRAGARSFRKAGCRVAAHLQKRVPTKDIRDRRPAPDRRIRCRRRSAAGQSVLGGRCREAMRRGLARPRRVTWEPRSLQRVLPERPCDRFNHDGSCEDRGPGREATIVVYHAETGRETDTGILHLRRSCKPENLAQRFDSAKISTAGSPGRLTTGRPTCCAGRSRRSSGHGDARSQALRPSGRSRDPRTASSR